MREDEKTRGREDEGAPSGAGDARAVVLESFLTHYYAARPVNATFTGMHAHDHRLPDWSAAGVERAIAEMRAFRARLAPHVAAP